MTENNELLNDQQDAFHLLEEDHHEDFSSFTKEELTKFIESFNFKENYVKGSQLLQQIKSSFDHLHDQEKEEALQKFLQDGGEEGDFELKKDALSIRFDKTYQRIRTEISEYFNQQEKVKEQNLRIKQGLLDRLRTLISSEESALNLEEFRKIQDEWKATGAVPSANAQELYANYKALIDIFYNNRSIIFDLLELDRKKNLEQKIDLCEKAELLAELSSINQALKELKVLHEEFRNVGPVPKEDQEQVWNRFKVASDKVYERRKEYFEEVKKQQEVNLQKKLELLEKVKEYEQFDSARIDDWKAKTMELTKLQEEWKAIGGTPNEKTKEANHQFWEVCKVYYRSKNAFFKQLDKKREDNLKYKNSLSEKAEALLQTEDIETAIREVKELQRLWDKAGQVPFKFKESSYNRFKAACDAVFQKKRELNAEAEKEYWDNLEKKKEVCAKAEAMLAAGGSQALTILRDLQREWDAIGFVPKEEKQAITERFNKSMNALVEASSEIAAEQKKNFRLSLEVMTLKSSPDGLQQLKKKEQAVAKRISGIKAEIDRYKTNIEFFGRSKNADQLKKDIQVNIDTLEVELKSLQSELTLLKS
ncbi:MAG: DUF349 domain-containing protein [Cytophagaceae bacterium]|nr:DUF349 domain-containing protein [Cytophagaceae bacterium]